MHIYTIRGGSRFCGALKLIQFLGPSVRKGIQNLTIKLGMKVNIYLGHLPGPWKGPVRALKLIVNPPLYVTLVY